MMVMLMMMMMMMIKVSNLIMMIMMVMIMMMMIMMKVANLRLAAAQVFQEKISDEAKNLRSLKAVKAKKFVDRYLVSPFENVFELVTSC